MMSNLCPYCNQSLPELEELSPITMANVVELLNRHLQMIAIEHVQEHTKLTFEQARSYIECPHGLRPNSQVTTQLSTKTSKVLHSQDHPYPLCIVCNNELPKIKNIDSSVLHTVAQLIAEDRKIMAIKEIRDSTRWGLLESKEYVECPHKVPLRAQSINPICKLCSTILPTLPNTDEKKLSHIAYLLSRHEKLQAIKLVREYTKWGLKESAEYSNCPHPLPKQ